MADLIEETTPMTKTKEKILFETNELVISLNTQVAVLTNSNNDLKRTVEGYMDKLDRKMDKLDERDATLDQRVTIMRNDLTKAEGKVDAIIGDVMELKEQIGAQDARWKIGDLIVGAGALVAGLIAWFK